jgi:phytoene desaturase
MRIAIIGGGLGGLATACLLAASGNKVTLFEKNEQLGGRASVLKIDGFTFDMGPSWYLMPEFFEHFFSLVGERIEDYYHLQRLEPSYRIFFKGQKKQVDFYGELTRDLETLEKLEPGCSAQLRRYLETARIQYEISTNRFIYKNYDSVFDFFTKEILKDGLRLHVFESMESYIKKQFKSPEVQKILQYTLVFLGSSPARTPALYSLMSHIDFHQGVFYPMGGIGKLPQALEQIGKKHGVEFRVNAPVKRILLEKGVAKGLELESGELFEADCVISNADIAFTEQALLPEEARDHSAKYWKTRTLAPSALMLYLGIDIKLPTLKHHNLLFCENWKQTFDEIFERPTWPSDPSLYICAPSVTDPSVAPAGMENLFILVPIAADLPDTEDIRAAYIEKILAVMEKELNLPDLRSHIVVQKSFCVRDFKERYHSLGGTALGLAHTLKQTAIFRPNNVSKNVKGLYYVGADTNPGIGMPMVFASAELVYKRLYGIKTAGPLEALASTPLQPKN